MASHAAVVRGVGWAIASAGVLGGMIAFLIGSQLTSVALAVGAATALALPSLTLALVLLYSTSSSRTWGRPSPSDGAERGRMLEDRLRLLTPILSEEDGRPTFVSLVQS